MKKFLSLIIVGVVAVGPVIVLAQNWDIPQSNDGIAYASIFAGNFSLLLSILIGIIANVIIFRAAKRLGGGLFGSVLNYIGIGVSFIVLGTIATVVNPWFISFWFNITSFLKA